MKDFRNDKIYWWLFHNEETLKVGRLSFRGQNLRNQIQDCNRHWLRQSLKVENCVNFVKSTGLVMNHVHCKLFSSPLCKRSISKFPPTFFFAKISSNYLFCTFCTNLISRNFFKWNEGKISELFAVCCDCIVKMICV